MVDDEHIPVAHFCIYREKRGHAGITISRSSDGWFVLFPELVISWSEQENPPVVFSGRNRHPYPFDRSDDVNSDYILYHL